MAEHEAARNRKDVAIIIGLALVVVVVIVAVVGTAVTAPTTKTEIARYTDTAAAKLPASVRPARDLAAEGALAEARAEDAVKQLLRDPESATFRDVVPVPHENGMAVCGQVNAKNGFGGYTGFEHFIVIGAHAVIRTEETATDFLRTSRKACQ